MRYCVAQNENSTPEILNKLSKDKDNFVRKLVVDNKNTLPETLNNMLENEKERDIIISILENENLTSEAISREYKKYNDINNPDGLVMLVIIAANPNTDIEILQELSKRNVNAIIKSLCQNKKTPLKIIKHFLANASTFGFKDGELECHISRNDKIDKSIILKLFNTALKSQDNDVNILNGLSRNLNTPPEILRSIYQKSGDVNMLYVSLAENINTPQDILDEMGDRESTQEEVALNTNTHKNTLIRLIKRFLEKDETVCMIKILRNTSLPKTIKYNIIKSEKFYNNLSKRFLSNTMIKKEKLKKQYFEKERDVNMSGYDIESSTMFYDMLEKRQELQYKYDSLNELYNPRPYTKLIMPESVNRDDSKLPIIRFNLNQVNEKLIKYMCFVITDWRSTRLRDRDRRINEMLKNEKIISLLESLENTKDLEKQRVAIDIALNTIHSSGSMIDHYGIDIYKLDYISNMDTTQWDRELEHMASSEIKNIKLSKLETTNV